MSEQQLFQIRAKISDGGVGLRSQLQFLQVAYLSSLLPAFKYIKKAIPDNKYEMASTWMLWDVGMCFGQIKEQGFTTQQWAEYGVASDAIHEVNIFDCHVNDRIYLQNIITTAIEKKELKKFVSRLPSDSEMRIRLLSASCKGAGLWQVVIPSESSLQMSDNAFRSSMKLLLGIV